MPRSLAKEKETKRRILDAIRRDKDGLTISDASRILEMHYTTVSKYLAVLEAEGKITHRDIGMAKLFKLRD